MKIAVLGASGLVGRTMLEILSSCAWVDEPPRLLVSGRSAGRPIGFRDQELVCRAVDQEALAGLDVMLCSAGRDAARRWAPEAVAAGCLVVDNSSAFRMDPGVPLVVPEVASPEPWTPGSGGRLIANPNCSTIQIAVFAAALQEICGLDELHAVTLQAVSGAGQRALDAWVGQQAGDDEAGGTVFPRPIAGNVLPAIGPALDDGSYEEETKVVRELRRILGRGEDLAVSCTAVRVPVHTGHSVALRCLLQDPVDMTQLREILAGRPDMVLDGDAHAFATPREIRGSRDVHVGRLRSDPGNPRALLAWVVADNLLKGAAWNAVQIVESCLGIDWTGASD